MDAQQAILNALKGATSAAPVSFLTLAEKTGLQGGPLLTMLDQMVQQVPCHINRAYVERAGFKGFVYWPTGIVAAPLPLARHSIKHMPDIPRAGRLETAEKAAPVVQAKPVKPAQPKPQAAVKTTPQPSGVRVKQTPAKAVADMAAAAIQHMENPVSKSKSIIAIEYLHSVGSATGVEIKQAVARLSGKEPGSEGARSYLISFIKRGLVTVSDDWQGGTATGKTYSVKPGMSIEQILAELGTAKPVNRFSRSTEPAALPDNVTKLQPKTANSHPETATETPVRHYDTSQIGIDPTGQLIIQEPGLVKRVFPREATLQIKKFLNAIDLESLCA